MELIHSLNEMKAVISERELEQRIMSKDYAYIQKRYFEHPIYQYDIWKIVNQEGETHSILITREEEAQSRNVVKSLIFMVRKRI